jgi:hypothetical protein
MLTARAAGALLVAALGVGLAPNAAALAAQPGLQPLREDPASATAPAAPPGDGAEQPAFVSAQNNALENEITPELDRAIARGLARLARMQNDDGSFGDNRWGRSVAITSLAGIAFMADGNLPGRGVYADQVSRALDNVLEHATESGLVAADSASGPMYGHGFATLFLGEVYGMTAGDPSLDARTAARLHEALVKAVRLIQASQNDEGGWRYNPVPYDADVSVTICQVMALRSARNAGLEVPKETIDRAVEYIRRTQNPDGGWRYQMQMGSSLWPRSAAGVASLFYSGIYEDEQITRGIDYLMATARPGLPGRSQAHYFYGHYYAVQAMYLAGGDAWAQWWPEVRRELLESQRPDGGWDDPSVGEAYGTAMALIVLQMPKRYLQIFQK